MIHIKLMWSMRRPFCDLALSGRSNQSLGRAAITHCVNRPLIAGFRQAWLAVRTGVTVLSRSWPQDEVRVGCLNVCTNVQFEEIKDNKNNDIVTIRPAKSGRSLPLSDGHLLTENSVISCASPQRISTQNDYLLPDGNLARRTALTPGFYWDHELPGVGLRAYPSGRRRSIVQYRHCGNTRRVTLGDPERIIPICY
ncbi:hypothetical protein SAMN05518849_12139 [Sphingobium sp. AP50]|nr:hypothetical protein SAMN05518849_12139 [Sphingobium sp. AP50]